MIFPKPWDRCLAWSTNNMNATYKARLEIWNLSLWIVVDGLFRPIRSLPQCLRAIPGGLHPSWEVLRISCPRKRVSNFCHPKQRVRAQWFHITFLIYPFQILSTSSFRYVALIDFKIMLLSPTNPSSYVQLRDSILARHLSSVANRYMTGKDGDTTESKAKSQKEHRRAQVRKAQMWESTFNIHEGSTNVPNLCWQSSVNIGSAKKTTSNI